LVSPTRPARAISSASASSRASAAGAHGILDDNPVQRALRDVYAVGNHTASSFDRHGENYARAILGLPPAAF